MQAGKCTGRQAGWRQCPSHEWHHSDICLSNCQHECSDRDNCCEVMSSLWPRGTGHASKHQAVAASSIARVAQASVHLSKELPPSMVRPVVPLSLGGCVRLPPASTAGKRGEGERSASAFPRAQKRIGGGLAWGRAALACGAGRRRWVCFLGHGNRGPRPPQIPRAAPAGRSAGRFRFALTRLALGRGSHPSRCLEEARGRYRVAGQFERNAIL
jgi:hypothetical protein